MIKEILKKTSLLLGDSILDTEIVDRAIALKRFLAVHRRLPKNQNIFNDYLYKIKTSKKITDPLRVFVSDKEFVKIYINSVVGEKYNVPTVAILNSPRDVYEFNFPENCCIKPTQASGEVIIRTNNSPVDLEKVISWFALNYYKTTKERNYKTLIPKVIVEPLIFGKTDLTDYRIFCYMGKPKLISLDIGKYSSYTRAFYDTEWNEQSFSLGYPKAECKIPQPENLKEMLYIAERLSMNFDLIRIDIYSDGTDCYVGEITNCHASAGQSFIPKSAEKIASKMIFE